MDNTQKDRYIFKGEEGSFPLFYDTKDNKIVRFQLISQDEQTQIDKNKTANYYSQLDQDQRILFLNQLVVKIDDAMENYINKLKKIDQSKKTETNSKFLLAQFITQQHIYTLQQLQNIYQDIRTLNETTRKRGGEKGKDAQIKLKGNLIEDRQAIQKILEDIMQLLKQGIFDLHQDSTITSDHLVFKQQIKNFIKIQDLIEIQMQEAIEVKQPEPQKDISKRRRLEILLKGLEGIKQQIQYCLEQKQNIESNSKNQNLAQIFQRQDYKEFFKGITDRQREIIDLVQKQYNFLDEKYRENDNEQQQVIESSILDCSQYLRQILLDFKLNECGAQFNYLTEQDEYNPRVTFDKTIFQILKEVIEKDPCMLKSYAESTNTYAQRVQAIQFWQQDPNGMKKYKNRWAQGTTLSISPVGKDFMLGLERIIGKYKDKLGEGASAIVSKYKDKALKIFKGLNINQWHGLIEELMIHQYVSQNNNSGILEYYKSFYSGQVETDTAELFTQVEFAVCSMEEMVDVRRRNNRSYDHLEILNIAQQLLKGLKSMHQLGVAHRDIKLSNILLSEKEKVWKYSDFGISEIFDKEGYQKDLDNHTVSGTFYYVSPQLLKHAQFSNIEDFLNMKQAFFSLSANDRYSLGLTLLNLINLETFQSLSYEEVLSYRVTQHENLQAKQIKSILDNLIIELMSEKSNFAYDKWIQDIEIDLKNHNLTISDVDMIPVIDIERKNKITLLDQLWQEEQTIQRQSYDRAQRQKTIQQLREFIQKTENIDKEELQKIQTAGQFIDYFRLQVKILKRLSDLLKIRNKLLDFETEYKIHRLIKSIIEEKMNQNLSKHELFGLTIVLTKRIVTLTIYQKSSDKFQNQNNLASEEIFQAHTELYKNAVDLANRYTDYLKSYDKVQIYNIVRLYMDLAQYCINIKDLEQLTINIQQIRKYSQMVDDAQSYNVLFYYSQYFWLVADKFAQTDRNTNMFLQTVAEDCKFIDRQQLHRDLQQLKANLDRNTIKKIKSNLLNIAKQLITQVINQYKGELNQTFTQKQKYLKVEEIINQDLQEIINQDLQEIMQPNTHYSCKYCRQSISQDFNQQNQSWHSDIICQEQMVQILDEYIKIGASIAQKEVWDQCRLILDYYNENSKIQWRFNKNTQRQLPNALEKIIKILAEDCKYCQEDEEAQIELKNKLEEIIQNFKQVGLQLERNWRQVNRNVSVINQFYLKFIEILIENQQNLAIILCNPQYNQQLSEMSKFASRLKDDLKPHRRNDHDQAQNFMKALAEKIEKLFQSNQSLL